MGAWGIKNFENDTAGDWLYDFEENSTIEFLEETLDAVFLEQFLDGDIASAALAAMEAVTLIKGNSRENAEEIENVTIKLIEKKLDRNFYNKCIQVIDRILSKENNELFELWEESDLFTEWKNVVSDLKTRILNLKN